jgi:hypothetical protein
MTRLTLAQQYGERFAEAHEAHFAAVSVITAFAKDHPLYIPDPARPGTPWHIPSPTPHTIRRDGDTLSCLQCGVSVHAPTPPPRPLTPQEASLSRFD